MMIIYFKILIFILVFIFINSRAIGFNRTIEVDVYNENIKGIVIEDIKYLCGINSTYVIMRILDKDPKYLELYNKLIPKKESKVSIADLEKILDEYNIKRNTLKLSPTQLYDNPDCLFIMYTPPPKGSNIGHFSVVRVINENNVQIIDPPYSPRIIKKTDWKDDEKIIFIAIGENFKLPSKVTPLSVISSLMILSGLGFLAYGRFHSRKNNLKK